MTNTEEKYRQALIKLKKKLEEINLENLNDFSDDFYSQLFNDYNQVFLFELSFNAGKILTEQELTLLNNNSYNSCLNLFYEREREFLISSQDKYPVAFEKLEGYQNLVTCWLYFSVDDTGFFIVENICSEIEILKKRFSIFEEKHLSFEFLIDDILDNLNHHISIFLECLSIRSIIVFTYFRITNFSFFNVSLFKLIFSIDFYIYSYLNILIKFVNESLKFVKEKN